MKAHLFRLSGQTVVYGLAGASLSLVGLFTLPVYTRVFSPAEYGALEIIVVAIAALGIVIDLGLGPASQRSYYDYPATERDGRRAVLATALITSLAIACAVTGLVVALSPVISDLLLGSDDHATLVAVAALTLPAGALAQLTREVMRLTLRPWAYLTSSALAAVVGSAAAIALVSLGDADLEEVQWGGLIGAGLAAAYGLVVVRRDLGLVYSRRELRIMLAFGLPLVPTGFALWGLSLLDRFILQWLDGLAEVGVYGVANRAASVVLLGVAAFTTAWMPFMLSLHAEDAAEERRVRARVLLYLTVAMGLLALVLGLFAREAIGVVAPGYEEAADAVGLLALGLVFHGIGVVAGTGITIARRTAAYATYTLAGLVLNIALCLALIPPLGQVGAAAATCAAYALVTVLQYLRAQRLDPAPFDPWRVALALAICAAPLPLGTTLLDPGLWTAAAKLAAIAAVVAALFATGVLGPLERAWLRELTGRAPRV